jgi:protein-disulfide isomerase
MEPLEHAVDHVRGSSAGRLIVEYGDYERFDSDRTGAAVLGRVRRDMQSGMASGDVRGTPTLFIDGVVYHGGPGVAALLERLAQAGSCEL